MNPNTTALYLIRHTRPAVAPGICYGSTDLDLAPGFEAEIEAAARRVPREVEEIVSSPLRRCRLLAEHLAAARDIPLRLDPRLQEMDFGSWEGRSWDSIGETEIAAWAAGFLHARPHGGESVNLLRLRVREVVAEMRGRGAVQLAVTHGGVIKAALSSGDSPEHFPTSPDFGAICALLHDATIGPETVSSG